MHEVIFSLQSIKGEVANMLLSKIDSFLPSKLIGKLHAIWLQDINRMTI